MPPTLRSIPSPRAVLCAVTVAAGAAFAVCAPSGGPAQAAGAPRAAEPGAVTRVAGPRLRFGIYPGGAVGKVGGQSTGPSAEDRKRRNALLRELRGRDREDLVLHVYADWTGTRSLQAGIDEVLSEARAFANAGFLVELVVRYRPARTDRRTPGRYAAFLRELVPQMAASRNIRALQVGNEANVTGAPDAADGAYDGARLALVNGVMSAKRAIGRTRRRDLTVGFNWAAAGNTGADSEFWTALRRFGGARFAAAVDWVGADLYPGTFHDLGALDGTGVRQALIVLLHQARTEGMALAGLGRDVELHVTELGFPTGAIRDEATQAALLEAAVRAIDDVREFYNVTDLRFFALRDLESTSNAFEDGYGLLRTDYTPKPGFGVFRDLVAQLSR